MKTKRIVNYIISIITLFCLIGCSMDWSQNYKNKVTIDEMKQSVSRTFDCQLKSIEPYLEENLKAELNKLEKKEGKITGSRVVEKILEEEKGKEYLNFCYSAVNSDNADDVVKAAESLMSKEEYEKLVKKTNEANRMIKVELNEMCRRLSPTQEKAFFTKSKKLLTRSIVLLTAGIVYTFVPDLLIWGKVSAAVAIGVAAGLVSSTIMSLWEFYHFDYTSEEFFEKWLNEVKKMPRAEKAIIASAITIGNSVSKSPVVTGIIIAVFGLYSVLDFIKPLINHYNFHA